MTNFEQLFQQQMSDPQFAQYYHEARIERLLDDVLNTLKEKISHNEPKENLLKMIDSIQQQLHATTEHRSQNTPQKSVVAID